jgi:hypothetical protein
MRYFILLFLLIAISLGYAASVYTTTDSNGNIIYSDTPLENAKRIPDATSTISTQTSTTKPQEKSAKPETPNETPSVPYSAFAITSPTDQQTFQNQRQIPIVLKIDPPLQKGDRIQLYVDGAAYGAALESTQLQVEQLNRGSHTLSASLIDSKRNLLKETPSITIFIQYATVAIPK